MHSAEEGEGVSHCFTEAGKAAMPGGYVLFLDPYSRLDRRRCRGKGGLHEVPEVES